MTETRAGMQVSLQQSFAAKAMLPRHDLDQARHFVDELVRADARGDSIDAQRLTDGTQMLDRLDARCIEAGFGFAVLVGQEAGSASDLDRRIEEHAQNLDRISASTKTLRQTLSGIRVR